MMKVFYVVLLFAGLVLILKIYQSINIFHARRKGIYPAKGRATEEDVKRLARSGNRVLAVRAYRELHACGLKRAKSAVDEMLETS
jgi:ribosomal protein L7/L12